MIVSLAKFCVYLSICPDFFQELIAASVVGEGSQAYEEKRYVDAFKILKPIADYEIDDAYVGSAQYIVGVLYLYGLGVQKDSISANKYFSAAARRKNQNAINYLLATKNQ
ncbi:MAG: SEL1-like repeat protein [Methyloprofundus sp.]|nr:SEL1-like repeat protein [Methyloprofundus sp.]